MSNDPAPIRLNLELIDQAKGVVSAFGTRYATRPAPGESAAGTHFRHVVDHYQALLSGLASGRVDYYARARDPVLENDPEAMEEALSVLQSEIEALTGRVDEAIHVDTGGPDRGDGDAGWAPSSVRRELAFVLSHTLHHLATIAAIARTLDVALEGPVGMAHSTLARQSAQGAQVGPED